MSINILKIIVSICIGNSIINILQNFQVSKVIVVFKLHLKTNQFC